MISRGVTELEILLSVLAVLCFSRGFLKFAANGPEGGSGAIGRSGVIRGCRGAFRSGTRESASVRLATLT